MLSGEISLKNNHSHYYYHLGWYPGVPSGGQSMIQSLRHLLDVMLVHYGTHLCQHPVTMSTQFNTGETCDT